MTKIISLDKNYSTTRCVINEKKFNNENIVNQNDKSKSKLKNILFLPSKKKKNLRGRLKIQRLF